MRARWLRIMWLGLGAALWLGIFEYVNTRAHNLYLYRNAEERLGIPPPPGETTDLRTLLSREMKNAAFQASVWAIIVTGAGLLTVRLLRPNHQVTKSQIIK